jgi:hypothetical protein
MNIENIIRKLARSTYYQNLLHASKEIGQISIFDNKINLSGLQVYFLHWLQIYESIYQDLSEKEWKYLDEKVIENDIRCDAFLYWRGIMRENNLLKNKQEQKTSNLHFKNPGKVTPFDINFQESGK